MQFMPFCNLISETIAAQVKNLLANKKIIRFAQNVHMTKKGIFPFALSLQFIWIFAQAKSIKIFKLALKNSRRTPRAV